MSKFDEIIYALSAGVDDVEKHGKDWKPFDKALRIKVHLNLAGFKIVRNAKAQRRALKLAKKGLCLTNEP